jgi:tripartite-type tricarboxylate transporter receptor subunit TctC
MKTAYAIAALLALPIAAAQAATDTYPEHPITFVVPIPAGGGFDSMARLIAEKLRQKWGQAVIVENRPGAASNIGADDVFHAAPDGYTLLITPPAPLVVNGALYRKLNYDANKFEPISVIATSPNVLLVHPSVKAANVPELIAYARAHPGKIDYASGGNGGTPHLTAELFQMMAKVELYHVPYKGNVNAHVGLQAGQVQMMFGELSSALPAIKAGTEKPLAVGSSERTPLLPDVPAVAETLPGFNSTSWLGAVAPPGTPAAITGKLSRAIAEILGQPDTVRKLRDMGFEPVAGTPQAMTEFLEQEKKRWKDVIVKTGATAN